MSFLRAVVKNPVILKENKLSYKISRLFSSSDGSPVDTVEVNPGGYAKSFKKFENMKDESTTKSTQTFATLLRNSKFIDLGDPEGKVVIGKIYHIVDDDLYIDFGWKFHCVCPRPKTSSSQYVRGARVRLLIKELELSSRFLGFEKDLTLLEADCVLLGLMQERSRNPQQ